MSYIEQPTHEIDLLELAKKIWGKKTFVAFFTALGAAIGTWYAYNQIPIYRTSTTLKYSNRLDILPLIYDGQMTRDDINHSLIQDLGSQKLAMTHMKENFKFSNYDMENTSSTLTVNDSPLTKTISISFDYKDSRTGAEWLNSYVDFILDYTSNKLVKISNQRLIQKKNLLNQEIEKRFAVAKTQNAQTLAKLQTTFTTSAVSNRHFQSLLESSFVNNIAKLQNKISDVESLLIRSDMITIAYVDQIATSSGTPLKSKKNTILAGILVGLTFGLFLVIIRALVEKKA